MGIVTPTIQNWRLLDLPTSAKTFKIQFHGLSLNRWSYIRLRNRFSDDEVSQSIRIYPKEEETIIELPIPSEFIAYGIYSRWLEVAKFKSRKYAVSDPEYQMEIEELL